MRKLALCFFAIFSFANISALAEDFKSRVWDYSAIFAQGQRNE